MRINHYFTCALACVLIAIGASSMPAKENQNGELTQQLHERRVAYRDALRKAFDLLQGRYADGVDGIDSIRDVSTARVALLEAELALESESVQRLKKIEEYVEQLKQEENYRDVRLKNGLGRTAELYISIAERIHGEIMLLQEQELQQRL